MPLQTTPVASQWLSSDHVGTPDKNTTMAQQQRKHVFCAVSVELIQAGQVCASQYLRVEAGKDTSTVIPVSLKRRRKGNPVVSDETVIYSHESSATLTTDRLQYKLQIHPLVREGAQRRSAKQFSGKRKEKVKPGHEPQRGARHQDILTDWLSVVK
jgi:hypothetical protein